MFPLKKDQYFFLQNRLQKNISSFFYIDITIIPEHQFTDLDMEIMAIIYKLGEMAPLSLMKLGDSNLLNDMELNPIKLDIMTSIEKLKDLGLIREEGHYLKPQFFVEKFTPLDTKELLSTITSLIEDYFSKACTQSPIQAMQGLEEIIRFCLNTTYITYMLHSASSTFGQQPQPSLYLERSPAFFTPSAEPNRPPLTINPLTINPMAVQDYNAEDQEDRLNFYSNSNRIV